MPTHRQKKEKKQTGEKKTQRNVELGPCGCWRLNIFLILWILSVNVLRFISSTLEDVIFILH